MRVAVIDLGTNTFNLLIVDVETNGAFRTVVNTKRAVKIGQGAMVAGELLEKPMQRAKRALSAYLKIIEEHQCDDIRAVATSGIRSTTNGAAFVAQVQTDLGLHIEIISGETEAKLIYKGVNQAIRFGKQPRLIMDIGGGSTEFIIADNTGVLWLKSFSLGISRVLQTLNPHDPLASTDLRQLNKLLEKELPELIENCQKHNVKTMVGASGSFDSFMEMIWAKEGIHKLANTVKTEAFNLPKLRLLHDELLRVDFSTRKNIPGLVEMRVDTIHLASYMVQWVMQNCRLVGLLLSSYAMKEGVIQQAVEDGMD